LTVLVTDTVCWNVGRFWNGIVCGTEIPEVTVGRLRSQHSGVGVLAHAPKP
jgi:hypothetical protein